MEVNFKVKCVKSGDVGITKGEIYEVVDGKLIDDDGTKRPTGNEELLNNLEDIHNYGKCKKYEWIGKFELVEELSIVFTGDIIELLSDKFGFTKGTQFEVTSVENGMIGIKSNRGVGGMTVEELKNFKIVKVEKPTIKPIEDCEWIDCSEYSYRTNGELVQINDDFGYVAHSKCVHGDEFDINKGIEICLHKIYIMELNSKMKILRREKQQHEEELHKLSK